MSSILAVNHHWHDALLGYAPTKLSIDEASDEFIDRVKQENLNGLKYFHLNAPFDKDGIDTDHTFFRNCIRYGPYDIHRIKLPV